jgi:ABC-2 type transport system ATP-binding protein
MGDVDALCKRIVIIDKGKMLYDNDIEHLKGFFGSYRTLKLRLGENETQQTDVNLENALAKHFTEYEAISVSSDDEWTSILINEEKIKLMDVMKAVQDNYFIRDMKLEEISTEEVIRKIYEEGV